MINYLLVNFGGPRSNEEIAPFLRELLLDRDVIRTRFPTFIHNWFFKWVAHKRAITVASDYRLIGGFSPIFFDTQNIAKVLSQQLQAPVLTFHRYLPATHAHSLEKIAEAKEIKVLPLFPQFSYSTTGSIARFLSRFPSLKWIRSYADHPAFTHAQQKQIAEFLKAKNLKEEETALLFSAHGLPRSFVDEGDIYESECKKSFEKILAGFPKILGKLCYQSKFGRGEWLRPYTNEMCEEVLNWHEGRKNIVFIPLSFTSDHIETLFEVEKLYLPIIAKKRLNAYRCPALGLNPFWIEALAEIASKATDLWDTNSLIRGEMSPKKSCSSMLFKT